MAAYSHRQAPILHFPWPASLAAISLLGFFLFCSLCQLLNYYYAALAHAHSKVFARIRA